MKIKIKNFFSNKGNLILILISFFIFVFSYICIKNEFFYSIINYIQNYLNYYVIKYLNSDINKLIVDNKVLLYIENDLQNVFSGLYIYVVIFCTKLFKIFSYILPIFIFYKISSRFYDEIYNKFSISEIVRIGKKKYINNVILKNGISTGLIILIPRILFLILLLTFFPNGVSYTHFINYASFITQPYLYVGYSISPIILMFIDFIICFLYGFVLSLISIFIVSIMKNKPLSYLIFIFSIVGSSIIFMFLKQAPIISYISIYNYFEQIINYSKELNYFVPIIIMSVICVLFIATDKFIINMRLKKNI